jgi:spoIIIJ-associated protein
MNQNICNQIEQTIREMLEKMNFTQVDVIKIDSGNDKVPLFNVVTQEDSKFLIGQHGDNLKALQHITRLVVKNTLNDTQERADFILDVNNYRREKDQTIIDIARNAARDAIMDKKAVVLREMSPYERRLVHMDLADREDVVTESIGEGEGRKVVVKPADFLDTL